MLLEKLSPEEEIKRNSILAFEDLTKTIIHTMEYWDRRSCTLVKPLSVSQSRGSRKGAKTTPKKNDRKSSPFRNNLEAVPNQNFINPTDPEIGNIQ